MPFGMGSVLRAADVSLLALRICQLVAGTGRLLKQLIFFHLRVKGVQQGYGQWITDIDGTQRLSHYRMGFYCGRMFIRLSVNIFCR